MTLSCKFKIPLSLPIVAMDSEEESIKAFISAAASEFANGNATLISADKFDADADDLYEESGAAPEAATFIRVIIEIENFSETEINGNNALLTQKALEILKGDNLQITHSTQHGPEVHIGFLQL